MYQLRINFICTNLVFNLTTFLLIGWIIFIKNLFRCSFISPVPTLPSWSKTSELWCEPVVRTARASPFPVSFRIRAGRPSSATRSATARPSTPLRVTATFQRPTQVCGEIQRTGSPIPGNWTAFSLWSWRWRCDFSIDCENELKQTHKKTWTFYWYLHIYCNCETRLNVIFLKWKKLQKKDTALFWVRCILYEFIYQRIIYFQTRTENVCTSPYTDLYLRDSWNYY